MTQNKPVPDTRGHTEMLLNALNPRVGEGIVERYGPLVVSGVLVVYSALLGVGYELPRWVHAVAAIAGAASGWFMRHQAA